RTIELAVALGAARVETLFFGVVAIDPAIAAITGQTAGIRAFYNVQYVPSGRLRLIKQWPRTSLQVSAEQGINPGNGVYLTSRSSNAGVNFSYSGLRHWNLGVNASYSRLGAVAQTVGTYTGY